MVCETQKIPRHVMPVGIDKAHDTCFIYDNCHYMTCCVLRDTAMQGIPTRACRHLLTLWNMAYSHNFHHFMTECLGYNTIYLPVVYYIYLFIIYKWIVHTIVNCIATSGITKNKEQYIKQQIGYTITIIKTMINTVAQ